MGAGDLRQPHAGFSAMEAMVAIAVGSLLTVAVVQIATNMLFGMSEVERRTQEQVARVLLRGIARSSGCTGSLPTAVLPWPTGFPAVVSPQAGTLWFPEPRVTPAPAAQPLSSISFAPLQIQGQTIILERCRYRPSPGGPPADCPDISTLPDGPVSFEARLRITLRRPGWGANTLVDERVAVSGTKSASGMTLQGCGMAAVAAGPAVDLSRFCGLLGPSGYPSNFRRAAWVPSGPGISNPNGWCNTHRMVAFAFFTNNTRNSLENELFDALNPWLPGGKGCSSLAGNFLATGFSRGGPAAGAATGPMLCADPAAVTPPSCQNACVRVKTAGLPTPACALPQPNPSLPARDALFAIERNEPGTGWLENSPCYQTAFTGVPNPHACGRHCD